MSLNEIIERFTLVSGYERKEISRFLPIIIDCKEFFEERIVGELTASQRRRVIHACAVYAYYRISRLGRDTGVSNFKAGDVQLVMDDDAGVNAETLWAEEKAAIADLVAIDDGFSFKAVSV